MKMATSFPWNGKSVVAVHAHPDDEAIWTGGLLAHLARLGASVTVITCTLGEEGEVIGDPLQALVPDHLNMLGGYRIAELRDSLRILQCHGQYLGGLGHWRDSGMKGAPSNQHPRAFVHSGAPAIAALRDALKALQPDLLITYGPDGGYGHPDHIRAHEITMAAAKRLDIPHVLWAVTQKDALERGLAAIERIPEGWSRATSEDIACVPDAHLGVSLNAQDWEAKRDAMRAHATQLWIADGSTSATNPEAAVAGIKDPHAARGVFALSNLLTQPLLDIEHYQYAAGREALEALERQSQRSVVEDFLISAMIPANEGIK